MDRKEKVKTFIIYAGESCVCGNAKHSYRWLCLECKAKADGTPELKALDEACAMHVIRAREVLEMYKQ